MTMASKSSTVHSGLERFFPARFHDSNFVTEYGRLEGLRASRYGKVFSLLLIQIVDTVDAKEHVELLKALSSMTVEVLRECDVAGMVGEKRLLIILPETDYFGSLIAIRKLKKAFGRMVPPGRHEVLFSQATCPKDSCDYKDLITLASKRVTKQKSSLWRRLGLEDMIFWEVIGRLLEANRNEADSATFDIGPDMALKGDFIEALNMSIVQRIARSPEKRGILYMSTKKMSPDMPILRTLRSVGETAVKVFLVTEGVSEPGPGLKGVTSITLDDPRLADKSFTFFLGEDFAYALVAKQSWQDTFFCFHSSDDHLVEGLILKLQRDFSLQEQL